MDNRAQMPWQCFVCGTMGLCRHRERDLVEHFCGVEAMRLAARLNAAEDRERRQDKRAKRTYRRAA